MPEDLQRSNDSPDMICSYIRAVKDFAEGFGCSPELWAPRSCGDT